MQKTLDSGLVWFRRDLRVDDHAALHLALRQCRRVYRAFIFDRDILDPLPRADRRVEFIRGSLIALDQDLRTLAEHEHAGLIVQRGRASEALPALAQALGVQAVYAAHDYEPQAQARDARVRGALTNLGIALHTCKDHVIFEGAEVLTGGGTPYTVFTPYKKVWLARLQATQLPVFDVGPLAGQPGGTGGRRRHAGQRLPPASGRPRRSARGHWHATLWCARAEKRKNADPRSRAARVRDQAGTACVQ